MSGMFDLSGRTAVVTGGGRGIGRAIAVGLARAGARVCVAGRTEATLQEALAEMAAAGSPGIAETVDVADEASVLRLRDAVAGRLGGLDILVNNAGIDPHYALLQDTATADWQRILDVNLNGVFFGCKHLGGLMLDNAGAGRPGANIINISSIAGQTALRKQIPYCASKGAVEQVTKALAIDWAAAGVRVNAVAYGFIETDLTVGMTGHQHIARRLLDRTPMGRFGSVKEVAGAAVFLASDEASYVTGHTLAVDGGWLAG